LSIDETLKLLAEYNGDARVINGGTDLVIEIERKIRQPAILVDISRVCGLDTIELKNGEIHIGAGVTHNQAAGSLLLRQSALPLARACWEVGAPQIRNRGTLAGNVVTASPANDTVTPLIALGARVTLKSAVWERTLPLCEFISGVRKTALEPDELLISISFPALKKNERGTFIKFGLRQAQAISVTNVAVILSFNGAHVQQARITLGSVAPTIVSAVEAQEYLAGKTLDDTVISKAAELAVQAARPIDDIRGSAAYRRRLVGVLVQRALRQLRDGEEQVGFPENPVMLWGKTDGRFSGLEEPWNCHKRGGEIETTINGKAYCISGASNKTLLRMLQEDIGLTGTKEGCAEGECGACTVLLDGIAVMSCLIPAPRAHHANIVTIEGLSSDGRLHPLQQAFIETGAVQCGYCTPGFLMSGVELLEEIEAPPRLAIQQALSGNLCRCTGYNKIIEAIEMAVKNGV